MIDNFSILLSHGLLMLTFWLLIQRDDCDSEAPPEPDAEPEGFAKSRPKAGSNKKTPSQNPYGKNRVGAKKSRAKPDSGPDSGDADA